MKRISITILVVLLVGVFGGVSSAQDTTTSAVDSGSGKAYHLGDIGHSNGTVYQYYVGAYQRDGKTHYFAWNIKTLSANKSPKGLGAKASIQRCINKSGSPLGGTGNGVISPGYPTNADTCKYNPYPPKKSVGTASGPGGDPVYDPSTDFPGDTDGIIPIYYDDSLAQPNGEPKYGETFAWYAGAAGDYIYMPEGQVFYDSSTGEYYQVTDPFYVYDPPGSQSNSITFNEAAMDAHGFGPTDENFIYNHELDHAELGLQHGEDPNSYAYYPGYDPCGC